MTSYLMDIFDPYADPQPAATSAVLGIDLGTTHSVVGIIHENQPTLVTFEGGSTLLPSIVAYTKDGQALIGEAALAQLIHAPLSGIRSVKRLMTQQTTMAPDHQALIVHMTPQGLPVLQFNGATKTPSDVSADILKHLKTQAEITLGRSATQAVITVPAYFDEAARQATKEAAMAAGLTVLRLINEPTAAALAYGLDQGVEGTYAVYDLGGGTFDVSLLTLTKGIFRVLATGGHTQLGGDDLDAAIVRHWGEDSPALASLQIARKAKHYLSTYDEGSWTLPSGETVHLTRSHLDDLARPFVDHTLTICQRVLADAHLEPTAIHGIILVGGATRMPLIRALIRDFFGKDPLTNLNPDEVVALGATLQAQALTEGSENLLIDVTPLSLGIETMGGLVEKIIERNSPIPTSQTQAFTTYQDNQSTMKIHILQGEQDHVEQCRSLGEFILSGIPSMPAGVPRIEVTYTLDADGLLTVTAQEKTTSICQTIEVKPSYGLTEEKLYTLLQNTGL